MGYRNNHTSEQTHLLLQAKEKWNHIPANQSHTGRPEQPWMRLDEQIMTIQPRVSSRDTRRRANYLDRLTRGQCANLFDLLIIHRKYRRAENCSKRSRQNIPEDTTIQDNPTRSIQPAPNPNIFIYRVCRDVSGSAPSTSIRVACICSFSCSNECTCGLTMLPHHAVWSYATVPCRCILYGMSDDTLLLWV